MKLRWCSWLRRKGFILTSLPFFFGSDDALFESASSELSNFFTESSNFFNVLRSREVQILKFSDIAAWVTWRLYWITNCSSCPTGGPPAPLPWEWAAAARQTQRRRRPRLGSPPDSRCSLRVVLRLAWVPEPPRSAWQPWASLGPAGGPGECPSLWDGWQNCASRFRCSGRRASSSAASPDRGLYNVIYNKCYKPCYITWIYDYIPGMFMYDVHFKLSCISWYIVPSTFPIENVKLVSHETLGFQVGLFRALLDCTQERKLGGKQIN